MKKQEATFKTEVTAMMQEPKEGDIPPVVVTTMEQMTTTIISGQVGLSLTTDGHCPVMVFDDLSMSEDPGTLYIYMARLIHDLWKHRVTFKQTNPPDLYRNRHHLVFDSAVSMGPWRVGNTA